MIKEDFKVGLNTIDAKMLSKMFLAGAKNLEHKKEWINELNVFPVPDGDTGKGVLEPSNLTQETPLIYRQYHC